MMSSAWSLMPRTWWMLSTQGEVTCAMTPAHSDRSSSVERGSVKIEVTTLRPSACGVEETRPSEPVRRTHRHT